MEYNIDILGKDSLTKDNFENILKNRHINGIKPSILFSDDLYNNFKRVLTPAMHLRSMGRYIPYTEKQKEIIYSQTLEQRVRGTFGSGKTTVLAARAVQAYRRALSRNPNPRILILTYNITLKNFIHDKIMYVNEDFPMEPFIIINYHQFINAELNNLGIDFDIPIDLPINEVSYYLEKNYYGNKSLFEKHKDNIVKYDAVFIDEIQDYKRAWMDIIKNYFRDPQGDYVLFGDVKQNIYGLPTENKDISTNVKGVNELKYCFCSATNVIKLAKLFQMSLLRDKYNIDDFQENKIKQLTLDLDSTNEGELRYMYLSDTNNMVALYNIIRGNIENHNNNISPNDITILGYSSDFIRKFDCFYRYSCRERTSTMVETIEMMYMTQLNYFGSDLTGKTKTGNNSPGWLKNFADHLKKKFYKNRSTLYQSEIIKIRQKMAVLFTVYDLYIKYPERFKNRLEEACGKSNISLEAYLSWQNHYKLELDDFRKIVYEGNYKVIRENKKLHFWMNSGTIKISTIHSFKGWESQSVFLIIEKNFATSSPQPFFDELIYTGLTRCRKNLVIINFGNELYDKRFRPIIDSLNNISQIS